MTNEGPAPPALGVKVNVASTPALPATRSPDAMLKATEFTLVCTVCKNVSNNIAAIIANFIASWFSVWFLGFEVPKGLDYNISINVQ